MDSIKQELSRQLINAGYANFEFVNLHQAPIMFDGYGKPFHEKERLLIIFKNRLTGCLLDSDQNEMVDFLKKSIETLESIPDESKIFYWQIQADGNQISGRSTEKQILHIYPGHLGPPS